MLIWRKITHFELKHTVWLPRRNAYRFNVFSGSFCGWVPYFQSSGILWCCAFICINAWSLLGLPMRFSIQASPSFNTSASLLTSDRWSLHFRLLCLGCVLSFWTDAHSLIYFSIIFPSVSCHFILTLWHFFFFSQPLNFLKAQHYLFSITFNHSQRGFLCLVFIVSYLRVPVTIVFIEIEIYFLFLTWSLLIGPFDSNVPSGFCLYFKKFLQITAHIGFLLTF